MQQKHDDDSFDARRFAHLHTHSYKWHTGYPGGLKSVTVAQLMEKHPERVLTRAVRGMVPRNSLHKIRMRRLRVFADGAFATPCLCACAAHSLTHLSSLSLLATDAHTHETDVEASKALAPDFVEFMEPRRYELREQEAGGDLVRELEEVPAEDLEAGEVHATLLLFSCCFSCL